MPRSSTTFGQVEYEGKPLRYLCNTYLLLTQDCLHLRIDLPTANPAHQGGADDLHSPVIDPWSGIDHLDLCELWQWINKWLNTHRDVTEIANLFNRQNKKFWAEQRIK